MIVGITTAPRPRPTVLDSLKSLRVDAGYHGEVAIFDDGCEQDLPANVRHYRNEPALGSLPNFFRALRHLFASKEPVIVLLEDDILWAKGGWQVMMEEFSQFKRPVLYSVHSSWTVSKPIEKKLKRDRLERGIYDLTFNKKGGGSNAYIMTRWVAGKLLSYSPLQDLLREMEGWDLSMVNKESHRDNRVTNAFVKMKVPIMFRIPSLVSHELGRLNSSEYTKTREWETRYFEPVARPVSVP